MKESLVLLYLRLFPATVSHRFRHLCYALLLGGVVFAFLAIIILAFACRPVSSSWTLLYPQHEERCINLPGVVYLALSLNIACDLVVFIMPIPNL
jgi:hypothetical protein